MSRLSSTGVETPGPHTSNPSSVNCNGAAPEVTASQTSPDGSTGSTGDPATAQERTSLDRVEEMMDSVGAKVGSATSKLGQHLYRFTAHAREALEDWWAEAQSIRRGEKQEESSTKP